MLTLTGKVALVTGGAQGIGLTTAKKLMQAGAKVALVDLIEETVVAAAASLGDGAKGYAGNVTNSDQVSDVIKRVNEDFGSIDILVNNAGITSDGFIIRMKDEQFDKVIAVNLRGAFIVLREVGKLMLKQKRGSIINISSVVGVMGNIGQANYSSSKAGLIGLTKTAAKEFASRGVRVNAVAPGYIRTAMTDALKDEVKDKMTAVIPLGSFGEADNVADAVAFLASDMSSYVTGQTLLVDGGMVM
ncbi:MAG: 3-oxoacyl-[acyl-carrier-protein] reductase [Planctomycetota bacterium]